MRSVTLSTVGRRMPERTMGAAIFISSQVVRVRGGGVDLEVMMSYV